MTSSASRPVAAHVHHVTNGDALSSKFAPAGIPGTVSIWCDVLHEGPVPGGRPHEELCVIRARYGSEAGYGPYEDLLALLKDWRRSVDERGRDELVLWYEHDLFDQLNLIQILDYISARSVPPVTLVSIDAFPGYPGFRGMGELTPPEIATLFPRRQEVTRSQFDCARAAWAAFGADSPQPLREFLTGDCSALPYLGAALARHLEEFPSAQNGLSRTEQQLLELVSAGPMPVREAFSRLHALETCFFIGDTSFWSIVLRLATSTPALLDVEIEGASHRALPAGVLRLTDAGHAVVSGRADRVELCGIDRWLGGVHVTAAHPWRR